MQREAAERWVEMYERLWRTPGTDLLTELFTADASYRPSPWARPFDGMEEIERFWESERDNADEQFAMSSEVVAVDDHTAVVRVAVDYTAAHAGRWRDLWVLEFAPDGRCHSFEEWPFAPDQLDGH